MTFATSQTVDNYEFLGIIDKPAAGVTYKVRNLATGEFEVLRALPGESSRDPESLERFLREIRVHTRLSHPNIVAFHDALELDGQLVMTAEFVEGASLAERCREGPLPSEEAVREICDVLAGLEEAHSLGIVHRAITADHVIVTPQGEVKLGGFGLAKPAADLNLTKVGLVLGDPRYISPEQVNGVTALDARSDLYSVGVLLYQALTGKVPFRNPNDFDTMMAHVGSMPEPPSSRNPGISPALDRIVLTALAKKPEDRFPNAAEFRAALMGVAATLPRPEPETRPKPQTVAEVVSPQLPVQSGSSKTRLVVGILSVIAIIFVAYMAMH